MLLQPPKAPALAPSPNPPVKGHLDALMNILRLYFVQLDSVLGGLLGRMGGRHLHTPHGAFSSTAIQTLSVINTPTLVTLNTVDAEVGVHYLAGNGLHVDYSGVYNLQFSIQMTNTDVQDHDALIFLKKDGTQVPWTTSVVTVASTHGGQPGYYVLAANFYIELLAGEYVELWWASNSTAVQLNALPALTTPPLVVPGSPSVVVTLSFVSNLE